VLLGIKHILASPFHPQTNGKVERYQQTLKGEVNRIPYEMPSAELRRAIESFVEYYNPPVSMKPSRMLLRLMFTLTERTAFSPEERKQSKNITS